MSFARSLSRIVEVKPAHLARTASRVHGAADADEGRQFQFRFYRALGKRAQHFRDMLDRLVAARLFLKLGIAPKLEVGDGAFGLVGGFFELELDRAGTNVRSADIDREHRIVTAQHPGWRQIDAADQPGLVWITADRFELDVAAFRFQHRRGARDRELAHPGPAQAAAHQDASRSAPSLEAQEPLDHLRKLPREILDDNSRRARPPRRCPRRAACRASSFSPRGPGPADRRRGV
ncbi:MAG TPA: hypothetical protein VNW24_06780 [Stellaceae bacterium]|nr:hypothetical protein [Stellaceae bacterium]